MYPYHNKIKQRISNNELLYYYFTSNYPKIGECLVLVFKTTPNLRPIRPHKYHEYVIVLDKSKMVQEEDLL
ncbi:MAG: hypothetical protein RR640_02125 [Oscillospiraceae bacterium]